MVRISFLFCDICRSQVSTEPYIPPGQKTQTSTVHPEYNLPHIVHILSPELPGGGGGGNNRN